ncbi:hypothetical protein [Actinoplanes sp. NPDC026623]|uniref:hypothetical protein n=1 Tax=Actinoplanes sp. NPDC026623 TaxID=3155610 RepID=UPI0033EFA96C
MLLVFALLGVALLWVAVDERVPMAVGLFTGYAVLNQVTFEAGTGGVPRSTPLVALLQISIVASLPVVLLLLSGIAARRQARL